MYSDDDANSDASSVCSERSYGSRNGGIPHYLRQTEDVAEVLNHCASSNWSERKEGLLGLQNLLKSQRTLRWGQESLIIFIGDLRGFLVTYGVLQSSTCEVWWLRHSPCYLDTLKYLANILSFVRFIEHLVPLRLTFVHKMLLFEKSWHHVQFR
jgi:hypothetical protein